MSRRPNPFRPYHPPGIPPAPKTFEDYRVRGFTSVPLTDARIIWNSAYNCLLHEMAGLPEISKETVIDLTKKLRADDF